MRFLRVLLLSVVSVGVLFPGSGWAQAEDSGPALSEMSEGAGNILITPSTGEGPALSMEDVSPDEGLEVVYNPDDYPLTREETDIFNAKKKRFIERFSKVLRFFRVKQDKISKAEIEIGKKFDENAALIARSNTVGGTVSFTVNGGLALPRRIVQYLQQTRLGAWLPASGGFYYVLQFGYGFVRQVQPDGRSKWVFESFVDFEKLVNSITGIVEAGFSGSYGVVYESRDQVFATSEADVSYGGPFGSFRQGRNQFGWAGTTGVSFPPFIGMILVYKDRAKRFYLVRASRDGITIPLVSALKAWTTRVVRDRWWPSAGAKPVRTSATVKGLRCDAIMEIN